MRSLISLLMLVAPVLCTVCAAEVGPPVTSPTISKAFDPTIIDVNGTATLTFTITNPNPFALDLLSFADTFPAGVEVASPNGLTTTCDGTTVTGFAPGSTMLSVMFTPLAGSSQCTFSINVTGTTLGTKDNTSDPVKAFGQTLVGNMASATLSVIHPPTISKQFAVPTVPVGGSTTLTFTVGNPGTNSVTLMGVAFTDTLPAGLVVANPSGSMGTCTMGSSAMFTAAVGSNEIDLTSGSLLVGGSCTFSVNVVATTAGLKENTTGAVSSTNGGTGGTAMDDLLVLSPPTIAKTFGAEVLPVGGTTSLQFTLTNPNPTGTLTGVSFSDALPAGLVVATPNGLTNLCGGTVTATAGSAVISLSAGSIPAASSCTITVNVTGIQTGRQNNTTSGVTSTNGGSDGAASASIIVVAQPAPVLSFGLLAVLLLALGVLGSLHLSRGRRSA